MAKPNRQFGELSKTARDRAARSGREYGLTRKQVRERYNRGTYNPFARAEPAQRIPREFRDQAVIIGDRITVDWQEAALANMRRQLGTYFKFNDDAVVYNVYTQANQDVLKVMAMASEDELTAYARIQDDHGLPPQLPAGLSPESIGYYTNGKWNNIFWYH